MNENIISKQILEQLSSDDKAHLLSSLETLIQGTYAAEESFRQLKAVYEAVFELMPIAVWVLEKNGAIFYQNAMAKSLEPMLGKIEAIDSSKRLESSAQHFEEELEYNGAFYLLQCSTKFDKQVITATNISNQKRQERLATIGQVSAHLAHEIRNPIGSISLLTSSLLKRGSESIKPLVLEMKKALWRVERLINATLLFTKGVSVNLKPCDISQFENDLYDSIGYYTYAKPISFDFKLSEGADSSIKADFELMCIVFQNFLSNAIDAIEEGECEKGEISVKFSQEKDFYCFSFSDNGIAIVESSALFEPFKSTKLKGNGLGLALCKQIISAHNGVIELETSKKCKTFCVKIAKVL